MQDMIRDMERSEVELEAHAQQQDQILAEMQVELSRLEAQVARQPLQKEEIAQIEAQRCAADLDCVVASVHTMCIVECSLVAVAACLRLAMTLVQYNVHCQCQVVSWLLTIHAFLLR